MSRVGLTDLAVKRIKKPGRYSDGRGLYLQVTKGTDGTARKSWVLRLRTQSGKKREMGLGSADIVDLRRAREKAFMALKLADDGVDPIDEKRKQRAAAALAVFRTLTFKEAAEAFIGSHELSWRNPKHRQQWRSTLETYAYPAFGNVPVHAVDVSLVTRVLDPIWRTKTETASRLRGRIEAVLDWATVRGYRSGENPARWRGHLQRAFPARSRVQKVEHHPALPYQELPQFMEQLGDRLGAAARAMEFTILTGARTTEVLRATWDEFDLEAATWTVPMERMKAARPHRVPLSREAVAVLKRQALIANETPFVFATPGKHKPLSPGSMRAALHRMGFEEFTVHGFRSSFRDWAAEQTSFPREVAEAALAHAVGDKVEQAYRRSDLFEKRRALMNAWSAFCFGNKGRAKSKREVTQVQDREETASAS